jgi:hypothetical protein
MQINVEDYEKLGSFYLGREYDQKTKSMEDKLVMYDSKDLVTHGVVLGMTGSGKTGLCLALLEEAAMDGIPAIVIDPKGDIANFCLTFPDLNPSDFRPWINEDDAAKKGVTPDEFAAAQAQMWKKGLADWGQSGERIKQMRDKVDITVYTPGSNAGIPVSILTSMQVPEFEILDDAELLGDRVESTVSSILGLCGITADPIKSPEHILLSNIMNHCWHENENLDLGSIIEYVQKPPFPTIGVIAVDDFYPPKKRNELAMQINSLLASPGFATWMTGEPLDVKKMLYGEKAKPRIAIYSLAHLSDSERMFFVSLLLNQTVGWMRGQSGTTSLRALVYMDEIYGYLPPTQNPPSKKPMMILLKQARAFGVGVLLATQNPVDLDYKALSNIGTWFLGRLQTERDKNRVLDGLEGAASSQNASFNRASLDTLLAGLGNRVFLMNNTHEDGPVVFQVRWVMTYLRGPLTRNQIKSLMDPQRKKYAAPPGMAKRKPKGALKGKSAATEATESDPEPEADEATNDDSTAATSSSADGAPSVPSTIEQFYFPPIKDSDDTMIYIPAAFRAAEISINDASKDVFVKKKVILVNKLTEDMITIDPDKGTRIEYDPNKLSRQPVDGPVEWEALPDFARQSKTYTAARDSFAAWASEHETVDLTYCAMTNDYSTADETEDDFRNRIGQKMREVRDEKLDMIRKKFGAKVTSLQDDLARAQAAVDKQQAEARAAKVSTAVSIGQTILGVLFGRKTSSSTITSGARSARGAGKAWKETGDLRAAEEKLAEVEAEIAAINDEAQTQIDEMKRMCDPANLEFTTESLRPLKKNIVISAFGLAWLPYLKNDKGMQQNWQA